MLRSHATNFLQMDPCSLKFVSSFPSEVFYEIGSHLDLKDLRSFQQTDRKIQLSVAPLIPFKIQEHLEILEMGLLAASTIKTKLKNPENFKKFYVCKSKVGTFKNGSLERSQALRDVICSLFDKISFNSLFNLIDDHPFSEDKLLAINIIKNTRTDGPILWKDNPKDNKIFILILDLLKKNELDLKEIKYRKLSNFLDETILESMVNAINENQSIVRIDLSVEKWNLIHLEQLLEAIKNNQQIKEISITEYNFSNIVFGKQTVAPEDIEQLKKIKELIIHHFGDAAIDNTLAQGYWNWTR